MKNKNSHNNNRLAVGHIEIKKGGKTQMNKEKTTQKPRYIVVEKILLNAIYKKDYKMAYKTLKFLYKNFNCGFTTKNLRVLLCEEFNLKKQTGLNRISFFIKNCKKNNLIKTKPLIYKSKYTTTKEVKRFIDFGIYWMDSSGQTRYKASPKSGYYRFAKKYRIIKIFKEIVIL